MPTAWKKLLIGLTASSMQQLLVSGSVAFDQIMNFPGRFKDNILPNKIHALSVSFFIRSLKESYGGTAGNIAYNLTLLGLRPTVLANIGSDAARYKKRLRQQGVDIGQLHTITGQKTPVAYIITDRDDNQISSFYPGAVRQPYRIVREKLKKGALAIIAPDNPINYQRLAAAYRAAGVRFIFDPGQQVASVSGSQLRSALRGALGIVGNDYEISLISKKTNLTIAQLQKKVSLVIVTRGAKGSAIYQQGKRFTIPAAKPNQVIDPTGAGDAYRAGLLYGLQKKLSLPTIGRLASVVAVYAVEKQGTQAHRFTWSGLQRRYRQNFGHSL